MIIDTAGRMQNKTNLMQELKKVHRVASPHIVFCGDALAGNDAVEQARTFQSFLNFDGQSFQSWTQMLEEVPRFP